MHYKSKSFRSSGLDPKINLVKCVAIIMIAVSHSLPYLPNNIGAAGYVGVIELDRNTGDTVQIFLTIFRNWGQIGNLLFLVCSAWLLIDKDRVRIEKIIQLIIDNAVIAWILLFLSLRVFDFKFQPGEFRRFIFPTAYSTNWYVTTYIFLYAIHGTLNYVIKSLSRKRLLLVNCTLFFMYFILVWWNGIYLYTGLIGFICVYLFVGYYKLYREDGSVKTILLFQKAGWWSYLIIGILVHISSVVLIFYAGIRYEMLSDDLLRLNTITNPIFLLIAFSLFMLVVDGKMLKNGIICKAINSMAQFSLYIYLIHGSTLAVRFLKTEYYDYIYRNFGYEYLLLWITIYVVMSVALSIILALIYKALFGKNVTFIASSIVKHISNWLDE